MSQNNFRINNKKLPKDKKMLCEKERNKIEKEISSTINKLINRGEDFPNLVIYGTPEDNRRNEAFEKFLLNLSKVGEKNFNNETYNILKKRYNDNEEFKNLLKNARNFKVVYNSESANAENIKTIGNLFLKSLYNNRDLVNPLLYLYFQEYLELLRICNQSESKSKYNFKLYCLEPFFRLVLLNYQEIDCKNIMCGLLKKLLDNTNNFDIKINSESSERNDMSKINLSVGGIEKIINLEMKSSIEANGNKKYRKYTYCFKNIGLSNCYEVIEDGITYSISKTGENLEDIPMKILEIKNEMSGEGYVSLTKIEYEGYIFKYEFNIKKGSNENIIQISYTPRNGKEKVLLRQSSVTSNNVIIKSNKIDGVRKSEITIKGISNLNSSNGIKYTERIICSGLILCLIFGPANTTF